MQSLLDLHRRPVVQFDPKNPTHREQVVVFLRTGTWSKSPYAFYAPENLSVKAYALQAMLEFYLEEEFPTETVKQGSRQKKSGGANKKHGKLISIHQGAK